MSTLGDLPSVLLSFRAQNFRSFRDELDLSMVATRIAEPSVVRHIDMGRSRDLQVLPVAGIFGSNASGKSNVLKAMAEMRQFVLYSFRFGEPEGLPHHSFRLDPALESAPSVFAVELVLDGVRYEYEFTHDGQVILSEHAYWYPNVQPALLFSREMNDVQFGSSARSEGRAVAKLLRPNALFLSTAAATNHPILLPLFQWFQRNLALAEVGTRKLRQLHTARMIEAGGPLGQQIVSLLRAADLGATGARVLIDDDPHASESFVRVLRFGDSGPDPDDGSAVDFQDHEIRLTHRGAGGGKVEFPIAEESLGTNVWFGLIGPLIDALTQGSVLAADELDASLHPALVNQVVSLFQNPDTNPRRAQLIFNAHDVTLLGDSKDDRPLGRDQIWFTEKARDGATRLYPLSDHDPRKDEAIGKRYLSGRYGAFPILSESEFQDASQLRSGDFVHGA